jgi:hypothetical protein
MLYDTNVMAGSMKETALVLMCIVGAQTFKLRSDLTFIDIDNNARVER